MANGKSGKQMGGQKPDNYMKPSKTTSVSDDAPMKTGETCSVNADSNRKWGSGQTK